MRTKLNQAAIADKLCERLAMENKAVAIYRAILGKLDDPGARARLEGYQREEERHLAVLESYLDSLGVVDRLTPLARLAEREGDAFLRLIEETDSTPRLLSILLTVELANESAWELLVNLGRDAEDEEMVRALSGALRQEKEHLRGVRGLHAQRARAELTEPAQVP